MSEYSTSVLNKQLRYVVYYCFVNNKIKKINISKLPSSTLIYFTLGNTYCITTPLSLFNVGKYFNHYQLNNINNIKNILFQNIDIKLISDINFDNIYFLYKYPEKIIISVLYQYKFSKDSLFGYNNIYIENFLYNKIINLSELFLNKPNKRINIYIEDICYYKIRIKNLLLLLQYKMNNKPIYINMFENINKKHINIINKICYYINNLSIYELSISI